MSVMAAGQPKMQSQPLRVFLNPYVQIGLGALLVTASEVLLKIGATHAPDIRGLTGWFGIGALASLWTWGAIVLYILSFISWLYVLRHVSLSIAFGLINVVHILVPLAAWTFLDELISARRWAGIALVLVGIALIARSIATVEEKL
jgi:drug/metabolite transporter (DMT)-like permease